MSSERSNLRVLRGRTREEVGTITAEEGLRTNEGRITRVYDSGGVRLDDGRRVNNPASRLTVAYSDAERFGLQNYRELATA